MYRDLNRLESVFLQVSRAATPADRAAILDQECRNDEELRRWVAKLLRKHDQPKLIVDTPVCGADATLSQLCDDTVIEDVIEAGSVIAGRYRLVEKIGQGGMGSVYRAEQFRPLRRTVAIKLLRLDLATKSMLARFEAERQALAKMDHPHIAKVYDAGTSPLQIADFRLQSEVDAMPTSDLPSEISNLQSKGRPYLVMELVDGVPITDYCVRNKLSLRQRVELFIPVCLAVEHAHQRGVIHRDLKPGNILITQRDGKPFPIVIDFGIAKCVDGRMEDTARHTLHGLCLGTFDYMAPEQAGSTVDIDTRSDVYSLGAVLYEVLTGSPPLNYDRSAEVSLFELATLLREQELTAPSIRIRQCKENATLAGIAHPIKMAHDLRGDLDWVVTKCLDKDRERRYPWARALADDLRHYLANEPVSAGPPSKSYRLRKLLRRHWIPATAICLTLLAMIGGTTLATIGMVQAKHAESTARTALADEAKQRKRADANAANFKFIADFIEFDVLRQANPNQQFIAGYQPDINLTVKTALDRSAATIQKRFGDLPTVEATLRLTIGNSYHGLGDYDSALHQLQRALELSEQCWGPQHNQTLLCCQSMGRCLTKLQRFDEAVTFFERVVVGQRTNTGLESGKTLAAENDLGNVLKDMGRIDEGEKLLTHVYETLLIKAPNSVARVRTLLNLAGIDECRGNFTDAIGKLESLLNGLNSENDIDPMAKFGVQLGLGRFYLNAGRAADGIRLLESSRDSAPGIFGEFMQDHLHALYVLSDAYFAIGRNDDAIGLLKDSFDRMKTKLPAGDNRLFQMATNLSKMAVEVGQFEMAQTLAREIEDGLSEPKHRTSLLRGAALSVRGRCHFLKNQFAEAEPLIRESLEILSSQSPNDIQTLSSRVLLGQILVAQGRYTEAEPELKASYLEFQKPGHKLFFTARRRIPDALEALSLCADALDRPNEAAEYRAEKQKSASSSLLPR